MHNVRKAGATKYPSAVSSVCIHHSAFIILHFFCYTPAMPDKINITIEIRADRQTASSGSKWEPLMGYSRAVRSGNLIAVTGTVGVGADGKYSPDLGVQTRRSLAVIQAAIESLGGKIDQVIRTRMYVTDVTKWEQVAKVHGEVFAQIRPATTIVQVAQLIDSEAQIEIEADAVVPDPAAK
jgi:enamine deaminase RidA (YjgF/YER057c/UK114 family)